LVGFFVPTANASSAFLQFEVLADSSVTRNHQVHLFRNALH